MTPQARPPFFTWLDNDYEDQSQIPERICEFMRVAWSTGVMVEEIAELFSVPVAWVETIVREASSCSELLRRASSASNSTRVEARTGSAI